MEKFDSQCGNCRVCGGRNIVPIDEIEFFRGYKCVIYDCKECLCRFTRHDRAFHKALHSETESCYDLYRDLAYGSKRYFDSHDLEGLRRELCRTPKYNFVIGEVGKLARNARILETGCSRGHVTSYFILAGYEILGVDISPTAIMAARHAFGDHFALHGDDSVTAGVPYDAIFHNGTIGCVADPVAFTRQLLSMLKPGGCLLFNAPNLRSCWLRRQVWMDGAPPPDCVTLFPPGFWKKQFATEAVVTEFVQRCDSKTELRIGLRKLFCRRWKKPMPVQSDNCRGLYASGRNNDFAWSLVERFLVKICWTIGLQHLAPRQPDPAGLFVSMVRK